MDTLKELIEHASDIETLLGYQFKDKQLLALAFIHRSYVNENREAEEHNERLEFLGDSVLGMLITEWLYRSHPEVPEGELSSMRSLLVEASSCFKYVEFLKIEQFLLLGKGEQKNSGKGRDSIIADLFEAVIGAIFLDGGLKASESFLFKKLQSSFEEILENPDKNWKALIQDYCQKKFHHPPTYQVLSEEGPDHDKIFEIEVSVEGNQIGLGRGSSKKEAQQAAAQNALSKFPPIEDSHHGQN